MEFFLFLPIFFVTLMIVLMPLVVMSKRNFPWYVIVIMLVTLWPIGVAMIIKRIIQKRRLKELIEAEKRKIEAEKRIKRLVDLVMAGASCWSCYTPQNPEKAGDWTCFLSREEKEAYGVCIFYSKRL